MNKQSTAEGLDALLVPLKDARDNDSETLLGELIKHHADPIISRILKSKLRVSLNGSQGSAENQDALEIAGELRSRLVSDLRSVQRNEKSITSFPDYVAIKTYSACADYFREKNPNRWRLKNLLRYQLKQNPRFSLWQSTDHSWYAGFQDWRGGENESSRLGNTSVEILEALRAKATSSRRPVELIEAALLLANRPLEFDDLVSLAAEVWDISDLPARSLNDTTWENEPEIASTASGIELALEKRLHLERLWNEILALPQLQRAALLLNLRDAQGASAIFFIPFLGIASQAQIADAIGQEPDDFAGLWNDLPVDDALIAEILGVTRQQVINLRKTARERLARRMKDV